MTKKVLNTNLHKAAKAKKDEFYTQLFDIERELGHYEKHFKNKVVFCNCDDPRVSNFFHYFSYNFEKLGLKKLITTCYKNQQPDLFSENKSEKAIYLEYTGDKNGDKIPNLEEIGIKHLKGDGDFRSAECIELLKQVDIVVTNPPFSLFREYVAQLVEHDKKFVIIGNQNAVTYKETFKLIKKNKIWFGHSIHSGDREFGVPKDYPLNAASSRIDKNGNKFIRVKVDSFTQNQRETRRYGNLLVNLMKKLHTSEFKRRMDLIFGDGFKRQNCNSLKFIYSQIKGFIEVPPETKKAAEKDKPYDPLEGHTGKFGVRSY